MSKEEVIKNFEEQFGGVWTDNSTAHELNLLVTVKNVPNINAIALAKADEEKEQITLIRGNSSAGGQTLTQLEETADTIAGLYGKYGPLGKTITMLESFISIIKQFYFN